jgi:DUF4097 and DUF4098 domain-containing protein YvlB
MHPHSSALRASRHHLLLFGAPALAALAATAPLGAQDRDRDRDDRGRSVASRIDTTLALAANGAVELSLVAGEIVVTTGAAGRVEIHATSERGTLELESSASRIALGVRNGRGRSDDSHFRVVVPQGTRIIAQSTSGDISVGGTRAEVDIHTVNGNIEVADAGERVTVETVSGDIVARGLAARVRVTSVNGDLDLSDVRGDLEAETVSGDLTLDGVAAKWVNAETVSGELRFAGPIEAGGRYDFIAHSGDVQLDLGGNGGITFDVETFSGEIESDFPITLTPGASIEGRPRRFEFAIGGGGARISVKTFSGDIQLERGSSRAAQED